MRILTQRPIVDQLVFRYNIRDHDFFRDCFKAMEESWLEIPFRNQPPAWFLISNLHPDNTHLCQAERVSKFPHVTIEKSSRRESAKPHALVGKLSKKGYGYQKNYLLVVPGLGRLYVHWNCLKFFVETRLLLRAQSKTDGLSRLIWRIYRQLWRVFGLWFFISDFDLAVDVDASPKLVADLRLVEERKHFILSGPLVRHKSHTFRDTRVEDENGVTFGSRSSRFATLLYDRDVCIRNASDADKRRLRRHRKILETTLYDHVPHRHAVRLEARFSDVMIWPGGGDDSDRPTIRHAQDFPRKQDWLHSSDFRRVYWGQLDHLALFRDFLGGLEILQSDLRPFQLRNRRRSAFSESVGHFLADNLRRIRRNEPDRWHEMRHPYWRFLSATLLSPSPEHTE